MFYAERTAERKNGEYKMQDNKIRYWGMRANQNDRKQIDNLAKRLGVKKSVAVRRAVAHLLAETKPKTAKVKR
jgi:hypothetical protein